MLGALVGCAILAHIALQFREKRLLQKALKQAEENVKLIADERRSERAGRTKAERELRELQLKLSQLDPGSGGPEAGAGDLPLDLQRVAFPMRPVGILHSCFAKRNGTPRQPLLVPAARATLTLRPDLAPEFFAGLEQYTHCWVMYVFHMNTDLQRLWRSEEGGVKGKIRVPRLDGGKLGVFATRSPHRPCPIGLSVARVLAVEGRTLVLGGADIVDGSPVLDVKPYVPFCDAVRDAAAPSWVAERAEQEPLDIGQVQVPGEVEAQLRACWQQSAMQREGRRLYGRYEDFRELVLQVLSRDIRSVTQRIKVPASDAAGRVTLQGGVQRSHPGLVPSLQGAARSGASSEAGAAVPQAAPDAEAVQGTWHVVLDGVDVSYDVEEGEGGASRVLLRTAAVL